MHYHPTISILEINDTSISPHLDSLLTGDWPSLKSIYYHMLLNDYAVDVSFKAACKLRGIKVFDWGTREPIALS